MSKHLETEIKAIKQKLFTLTAMVEESVQGAVFAVSKKDAAKAKEVIDMDNRIDDMEVEIEEDCLKILALHQPVAIDLRFIIAVLKMNNDLERIGDLAVNIAERGLFLIKTPPITSPFDFDNMASKTYIMLQKSIDSLINLDLNLARQVCKDDDEIDRINREMYDKVFSAIRKNPEHAEALIQYLSVSRHLERIADYATNIAEDVVYMVEGIIIRHKPENYQT